MLLDSAVLQLVLLLILCPIAQSFGIDMVHFGVVFTLNTMIGLCTPPFGMLFIVTGISGEKMNTIIKRSHAHGFVDGPGADTCNVCAGCHYVAAETLWPIKILVTFLLLY